jgi:Ca2+-binding RTX toxin-like protein
MSGSDMMGISLDLGNGDAASDSVTVRGTQGNDLFSLVGDSGYVRVARPQASISIFSNHFTDRLTIEAQSGADTMDAKSLRAGGIQLTMHGGAGADDITGSEGNDTITGGAGNDSVRMNAGNDTFVWNPGDDNDVIDGQAGNDTVIFNGSSADDVIDIYGWDTNVAVVGLSAEMNLINVEPAKDTLVVNALEGADGVTASTMDAGIVKLTVDGGAGDDVILGSKGADVLQAGTGDDFVYGDQGNDVALLGSGDDLFQWDAGNGSDTVEGQEGSDRIVFYGSDDGETIDVSTSAGRAIVAWDAATVSSDDIEALDLRLWGGADSIVLNELTGSDVTGIGLDLGRDHGAADSVTVRGTQGDDTIGVLGDSGWVYIWGLQAEISIFSNEAADSLTIDALGGADEVNASSLRAGAMQLALHGGDGDDSLTGSEGDDLITGGEGDDILIGGDGLDVLDGGPGDDTETE